MGGPPARPAAAHSVAIEPLPGGGVEVVDPVERRRCRLRTPTRVDPEPSCADRFLFPVDAAAAIQTDRVERPTLSATYVRTPEGEPLAEVQRDADERFDAGEYLLELCAPIKLYLRASGPLTVTASDERVAISFEEATRVELGARSRHERPATTVTTTDEPDDLLAAISTFGSALKTTSPERSFPTLRGHPPAIEVDDERSIPAGLAPPADDLRIEVPADLDYLLPVAPLAYYLGAPLERGRVPAVVGDGLEWDLSGAGARPTPPPATGGDPDFEVAVERTLKTVFFLECLVRTEGFYPVTLHERAVLEDDLPLDLAGLYDAPQAERLAAFQAVSWSTIEPHVPEWSVGSHVAPDPSGIEALPHLVDDLALVRTRTPGRVDPAAVANGELHGMVRGAAARTGSYVRTGRETGALCETWVGDGMPVDATKGLVDAYRNRVGRRPDPGPIDIAVVCNDQSMGTERDAVDEGYGSRADLQFDVRVHRDLTTDDLAAVLRDEYDLVHYVGHIDEDGFRCPDGRLDAGCLDDVGVDAFVLNACRSFEQGLALVEAGAIGGVVTLSDVVNLGAVRVGRTVAQLLDRGFPLHAALDVAREESVVGVEYRVVGDGTLQVAQAESGVPLLVDLDRDGDDWSLTMTTYTAGRIGGMHFPTVASNDRHYLLSGETDPLDASPEEVRDFLAGGDHAVRLDGSLAWSGELLETLFGGGRSEEGGAAGRDLVDPD